MRISLNCIQELLGRTLPPVAELVPKINQQLGGVEQVTQCGEKYKDTLIVQVISAEKHPDADRLSVCTIDDNGVRDNVERDEHGRVRVVCGAPNVRGGIWAVWLPPGATVPASYDKEPFVLEARSIRGVQSNGMLASPAELSIGDNHDGIVELTADDLPARGPAGQKDALRPGLEFARAFGLDDTIIDIENKMFTHRPDCFGQLGVAREIAGILGQPFTSPEWYVSSNLAAHLASVARDRLPLTVVNDAADKVPRFMAVALSGVRVQPSPFWLQCELVRLGSKPINNVVDITNYVMLLTAQPLHAYDYDKLRGQTLGTRVAAPGETLPLLNGKTYTLSGEDIVIVDGDGPVGLGGVMGGGNSEVSPDTTNIVLECATFDMYAVRKTSMRHGLFTEAVARFNKGQSRRQNPFVMQKAITLLQGIAGATMASGLFDQGQPASVSSKPTSVKVSYINDRLGLSLDRTAMGTLLKNVEFTICDDCGMKNNPTDPPLVYRVPFWRTDITIPEDIVEEIGRLYGFDKLPRELPQRPITPAPLSPPFARRRAVRQLLAAAGANEVLTYSFVHKNILTKAGQDAAQAYELSNALSPDLHYYRLSVLPSLLDKVHMNLKAGHDEFALYEFGKAHRVGDVDDDGLPREYERLALVYAAKKAGHAPYYIARRYAEHVAPGLRYVPLAGFDTAASPIFAQLAAPFEPGRSAVALHGDAFVGVVGEFTVATQQAFKLPGQVAGFELFQSCLDAVRSAAYVPLPRFPHVTQDISLKVDPATTCAALVATATQALEQVQPRDTTARLSVIGVYQAPGSDTKTITLRLRVANYERTLTDNEVATYLDAVAAAAADRHAAVRT